MEWKKWITGTTQYADVHKVIEQRCENLVKTFFDDEYAVEKFLKLFCEQLRYLEHCLLLQRGISPEQFQEPFMAINMQDYTAKWDEVRKIMLSEVERNYRHSVTFLSNVSLKSQRGESDGVKRVANLSGNS